MTQWKKFNVEGGDANNAALNGGKFVGLGDHQLRIDGVEPGETAGGNVFIQLHYSNEEGQTIRDRLYPIHTNKETGTSQYSFKYKSLSHALIPNDGVQRFEFFLSHDGFLCNNPESWEGLVGLVVEAEVTLQRRGYTILEDNGTYTLIDVETDAPVILSGGTPNKFTSFKDAGLAAKVQGLYRAFNEINKFNAVEDEAVIQANSDVIRGLVGDDHVASTGE
jgi:hypothetical protein